MITMYPDSENRSTVCLKTENNKNDQRSKLLYKLALIYNTSSWYLQRRLLYLRDKCSTFFNLVITRLSGVRGPMRYSRKIYLIRRSSQDPGTHKSQHKSFEFSQMFHNFNSNLFIIQSRKLLYWILIILIAWSRYPLALMIWGSILNLFISVFPVGYDYYAGYRLIIWLRIN